MPADRLLHPKCGKSAKVSMLTDLEFRVWVQYLLCADDFGVMHATAVELQSKNLHLANRPTKQLSRCLDALVKSGLLHRFEHQGQPYVFSHNWQQWQKVEYPRATDNPFPPDEALAVCDESTVRLLAKYPGGQRKDRRRAEDGPNDLGRASQTDPEGDPPTRARARAKRLTANGERLTANGSEGVSGEPPPAFDGQQAFMQLTAAYPRNRIVTGQRVQVAFLDALGPDAGLWPAMFDRMLVNLANHLASHEWRVKGLIPALDNWLEKGLWQRQLSADPPAGEQLTDKTQRTLSGAATFAKGA